MHRASVQPVKPAVPMHDARPDPCRWYSLRTGYGAGFWTNLANEGTVPVWDAPWGMPRLPKDMFYARGAWGQYVVIVP